MFAEQALHRVLGPGSQGSGVLGNQHVQNMQILDYTTVKSDKVKEDVRGEAGYRDKKF